MDSNLAEKRKYDQLWTHRGNKFVIGTLHGAPVEIVAQYNPKELSRQAAATWTAHQNTSARYTDNGESNIWSEYKTTQPRTLTFELLFDGYEEGISIAPIVESLERLTIPVNMSSRDPSERRPQLCVAVWGTQQLRCVVQSVATKLTMFDISGEPLRASCTVVLSEVDVAAMMKIDSSTIKKISQKGGGYQHTLRDHHTNPYPPEDSKPTRVPRTADPTASDTSSAAGNRESKSMQSAPAGASSAKSAPASAPAPAPASAPAPAPSTTPAAAPANAPAPASAPADAPASAPATAPANEPAPASAPPAATGTPSAQIDPNTIEGDQPGSSNVFVGEAPAPASPAATGTPSAQVDPNTIEGDQPGSSNVFVDEPPGAQTGTPSKPFDPATDLDSPPQQPPADATSSADRSAQDPKVKAVYDDLE